MADLIWTKKLNGDGNVCRSLRYDGQASTNFTWGKFAGAHTVPEKVAVSMRSNEEWVTVGGGEGAGFRSGLGGES